MSKALNNAAGAGGGFPLNRRLRRYGWIAPMIPGMAFLVAISAMKIASAAMKGHAGSTFGSRVTL